jgi:non-specific serine/threonine protein kinase/serine/threonine-protein kinase
VDFGIAEVLHPGVQSQTLDVGDGAGRCLTPDYATPEQVRGEPIMTASDIYSLGVLLVELLTGDRPYRLQGGRVEEVEQTICERDPDKPSPVVARDGHRHRLRRRLAGDLDNIVLMPMRKGPRRRYASVQELSDDSSAHLSGVPVISQKSTAGYRLRKFVRRHCAAVAMTVFAALLLVGGLASTIYQARVAEAKRARAERRFNDVRRLANSLLFELHHSIEKLPGSIPVRQLPVKRALEYLTSLSEEAGHSVALRRELATAFQKAGDIQGNWYFGNQGDIGGR